MFTRKRRFFERREFYISLALIFAAGFMVNSLFGSSKGEENKDISTNVQQPVKVSTEKKSNENNPIENNDVNSENNVQENEGSEYYLVKESDGLIKVYYYDMSGKEELIRTTDIPFTMISEEDQELFSEGVVVETEDKLLELLQDFES